jgi:hypothetical protein
MSSVVHNNSQTKIIGPSHANLASIIHTHVMCTFASFTICYNDVNYCQIIVVLRCAFVDWVLLQAKNDDTHF